MAHDISLDNVQWETRTMDPLGADHDVLVRIAGLLERILVEQRQLRAILGTSSQSSVELKTSERGVDIAVKVYADSPVIEAESDAISSYARVRAELEARGPASWDRTVSK